MHIESVLTTKTVGCYELWSARTLQEEGGEDRWVGLGDAIHQVREWRGMCVQSTQDCLQNCRSWQFTDESFGPMEFNDSHVKCTPSNLW